MKKTNRSRRYRTTARYAVIATAAMILGLVPAIALIGCNRPGQSRDESEAEEPSFAVAIELISRGEILEYIEVNGDVETTSTVDVFPETSGTLISVSVRIGDRVQLNQVLAEVDPSRPGQRFAPSPVGPRLPEPSPRFPPGWVPR